MMFYSLDLEFGQCRLIRIGFRLSISYGWRMKTARGGVVRFLIPGPATGGPFVI